MADEERPNLVQAATDLLKGLQQEYNSVQIAMLLEAARYLHTIDSSADLQEDRLIRGNHLDRDTPDR
ncbi:hypothetical protein HT576_08950 [Haloterrigena sp. SYSU A121-1]|uniref:Uncharacterized protein n=1 Tax=Haloterrigena gelatinilytica TaxID=2741724 RepID=A0A8J8GJH2_9EURY|nr:hypothetical protein [Haloterrigena gelatinilytica]NUB91148.1 hypothetical protein [Haloterrigena gelatinilytica]